MNGNVGPLVPYHHDQARIGHDQGIRLHVGNGGHIVQIGFQFGVVRVDIAGDVEFSAAPVGFVDSLFQRFQRREFIVSGTEAVTRLTGIHGIGAEIVGGPHFFDGTGWQ